MFAKIKETIASAEFKSAIKETAINAATAVLVGVAVKAVSYVVIEGGKALVEEIKNRNTNNEGVE